MATPGAPEEIFRFSIVRNPQRLSKSAERGAIAIVPPGQERSYPYFSSLTELRSQGVPRRDLVDRAAAIVADPKFVVQLGELRTAVLDLSDRLASLRRPDADTVRALVQEFGGIVSDGLDADRVVIADSLVAASIVNPAIAGLRGRLMRGLRAVELLRRLAPGGGEPPDRLEIARLLRATLLLPASLFPIPGNDAREEKNREEYARSRARLDKQQKKAQALLDQIAQNEATADELAESLSMHLFERQRAVDQDPPVKSIDVLPPERVERLSTAARRTVIEDVGMASDAIEVPFVVERLEKWNLRLGHDLATGFADVLVQADPFVLPGCGECTPVVLPEPRPENDFTPDTRGEVEVVGPQELLIVRQRLRDYRAGEIAHIENVLLGERKSKNHRKLDRSEVNVFEETERVHETEEELQTTEKYELQTESSRVIQEDRSADAGVTVTASYGAVNIEAHGNYASSTSTTEARNAASTFARDVVSRSVQRVRERTLERRSRTDISELEIVNEHQFDNRDGEGHVTGVYRWVDKFYEAQIVNYGTRTMLEFMVPDPAAFVRFAAANGPAASTSVPKPDAPGFCRNGVFHPLAPADLRPENYQCFVSKYGVSDVTPPVPRFIRVSDVVQFKVDILDGEPVTFAQTNDDFALPAGYAPRSVEYAISGANSHSATTANDDHDDILVAVVTIGTRRVYRYYKSEIGTVGGEDFWEDIGQTIEWRDQLSAREQQFGGYVQGARFGSFALQPSGAEQGDAVDVPVSLVGQTSLSTSVAVHYTVLCERTQSKLEQWQMDTFTAIQSAYLALKQEYDASLDEPGSEGLAAITGRNPLLNREVEKRELKKFAISLLTGQQYESFNAMGHDYATGIPQIDLRDAALEGRFVRFFEQAMEWKHITYLFYPYFWADKRNWTRVVGEQDPDPLFEKFLQAGFARVWVPVRPGFEQLIVSYLNLGGEPWTEKDAPLVEEPGSAPPYLSLIEEMKEQLDNEFEDRPGTVRVRRGDHVVTGTDTDLREEDVDREIVIALDHYRIDDVDIAAQTLRLREPYAGDDADALGVSIGVKFVGEPWLVQVPTSLVHLQSGPELAPG